MSKLTDEIADRIAASHYTSLAACGRDMIRLVAEIGKLETDASRTRVEAYDDVINELTRCNRHAAADMIRRLKESSR